MKKNIFSAILRVSYCLLLLCLVAITLATRPEQLEGVNLWTAQSLLLLAKLLPLLIFIPSLVSLNQRGLVLLSMVVLFYFCFTVIALTADKPANEAWLWLQVISIWGVYLGAIVTIRQRR